MYRPVSPLQPGPTTFISVFPVNHSNIWDQETTLFSVIILAIFLISWFLHFLNLYFWSNSFCRSLLLYIMEWYFTVETFCKVDLPILLIRDYWEPNRSEYLNSVPCTHILIFLGFKELVSMITINLASQEVVNDFPFLPTAWRCPTVTHSHKVELLVWKFSLLVGVYSFNLYLINGAKHLYMADLHSDVLQNVCLKVFAHLKNWVISYY